MKNFPCNRVLAKKKEEGVEREREREQERRQNVNQLYRAAPFG